MNADPLLFYNLAKDVLDVAEEAVKATSEGLPRDANVCVVPFLTEVDCCQVDLQVAVQNVYSSTSFPTADRLMTPCGIGPIAVVMTVAIRRCAPVVANATDMPNCDTLQPYAKIVLEDAWYIRRGIACFFAGQPDVDVFIGTTTFVQEARCAGSNLPVTIGVNDNCICPEDDHFYNDDYGGSY